MRRGKERGGRLRRGCWGWTPLLKDQGGELPRDEAHSLYVNVLLHPTRGEDPVTSAIGDVGRSCDVDRGSTLPTCRITSRTSRRQLTR